MKFYLRIGLLCAMFWVFSQNMGQAQHLTTRLGDFKSLQKEGETLLLTTDNGKIRISSVTPDIIRIMVCREEFIDRPSYAVIQTETMPFTTVIEGKDYVSAKTSKISIKIEKFPLRLVFSDSQGNVLNEDDPMGIRWNGTQVTNYKSLQDDEKFIGLGEKTGPLNRRGQAYENWNNDDYAYEADADPLYSSVPFYMGIHHRSVYGIFLNNTFRSVFNFGASNDRFSSFGAENGELDYYFFGGGLVSDIIEDYSWLTGRMELPPLWSLGFQQSRWSYYPESEVLDLAKTFREKKIPADVIYLDIHYMDQYKLFTWDGERFPDPKAMIDKLKAQGFHVVVIVDPGIKTEAGYDAFDSGLKNDVFVKYPDGTNYAASVWPGKCHFPDFTSGKVRSWWGEQFSGLVDAGVEGFWNDMNEPASWGNRTPDLIEFEMEGAKGTHLEAHNLYGMQMSRATKEGVDQLRKNQRSFILTRAAFAGAQRYTAKWTGDNVASDEHMLLSARMVSSMGLSGMPFAGPDIGGFTGERTPELFVRWLSQGVFTPFFRNHAAYNTAAHEPWAYGEWYEKMAKEYIELRYQLLPYNYSVFREASLSGMPVARSLAIDYTFDQNIYKPDFQNQYLYGPAFLIAPVVSDQRYTKVYLPDGKWFHYWSNKEYKGGQVVDVQAPLDRLPVFVKAGAIIPMQSVVQHTMQTGVEILQVHVYMGAEGSFTYYEDDGVTKNFEKDGYYQRIISLSKEGNVNLSAKEGTFQSKYSTLELIWHQSSGQQVNKTISLTDGEIKVKLPRN